MPCESNIHGSTKAMTAKGTWRRDQNQQSTDWVTHDCNPLRESIPFTVYPPSASSDPFKLPNSRNSYIQTHHHPTTCAHGSTIFAIFPSKKPEAHVHMALGILQKNQEAHVLTVAEGHQCGTIPGLLQSAPIPRAGAEESATGSQNKGTHHVRQ